MIYSSRKHKVMVGERYGFPGGTSTQMLNTFYGFFTPGENPKKIVAGLPDTIVDSLDQTGDFFCGRTLTAPELV